MIERTDYFQREVVGTIVPFIRARDADAEVRLAKVGGPTVEVRRRIEANFGAQKVTVVYWLVPNDVQDLVQCEADEKQRDHRAHPIAKPLSARMEDPVASVGADRFGACRSVESGVTPK